MDGAADAGAGGSPGAEVEVGAAAGDGFPEVFGDVAGMGCGTIRRFRASRDQNPAVEGRRSGRFRVEESLAGGGHEVVEQRAIGRAVGFVQVVLEFGELVFEDPAAGGGLVLEVFERGEKPAAEARQQLLGNDADQLRGEQVERAGGLGFQQMGSGRAFPPRCCCGGWK
jgi:hypothetical protein